MIALAAFAAQKAGLASMAGGTAGRRRRLAIREMLPLDARRRLAIVSCDDTEYLIILGPSGETVVDKGLEGATVEVGAAPAATTNPFGDFASRLRGFTDRAARRNAA